MYRLYLRLRLLVLRLSMPRRRAIAELVRSAARPADALRLGGAKIGVNVRIHPGTVVHLNEGGVHNLTIGSNVFVGQDVLLDLSNPISIADDVTVSARVQLWTHQNVGEIPLASRFPPARSALRIEANVYLGAGALVLHGVEHIPSGVTIGAGAVLTRTPTRAGVYVGIPARAL